MSVSIPSHIETSSVLAQAHAHHGHRHVHAHESRNRLIIVLVLTALYMIAEAFGGWWTGSLALLADAGHMLADVVALTLALMAVWFSARAANTGKTFGFLPVGILPGAGHGVGAIFILGYPAPLANAPA